MVQRAFASSKAPSEPASTASPTRVPPTIRLLILIAIFDALCPFASLRLAWLLSEASTALNLASSIFSTIFEAANATAGQAIFHLE